MVQTTFLVWNEVFIVFPVQVPAICLPVRSGGEQLSVRCSRRSHNCTGCWKQFGEEDRAVAGGGAVW